MRLAVVQENNAAIGAAAATFTARHVDSRGHGRMLTVLALGVGLHGTASRNGGGSTGGTPNVGVVCTRIGLRTVNSVINGGT